LFDRNVFLKTTSVQMFAGSSVFELSITLEEQNQQWTRWEPCTFSDTVIVLWGI